MERQVHRIYEMIAIRAGSRILAVTQENFRTLARKILPHLENVDLAVYMLTFSQIGYWSKAEAPGFLNLDKEIVSIIQNRISEFSDLLAFNFAASDAQKYLPDLLEAYRGNHFGEFAWTMDDHLGSSHDRVISVQVFNPPSLLDKITKRERSPRSKHVFNLSSVRAASGTSMRFIVECDGFALGFSPNGSVVRAQ